jgi:hypothetical protein
VLSNGYGRCDARRLSRRAPNRQTDAAYGPGRSPTGLEAFALQALALQLTSAPDGFGGFPGAPLRWLFIVPPELHFAEYALALHFLLQGLESLIDIVIANEDLHEKPSPVGGVRDRRVGRRQVAQL